MPVQNFHLLVCLSGHGYGHAAMTAPIINALHSHAPHIRFTIRGNLPPPLLESLIQAPFRHLAEANDIGMINIDALRLDLPGSLEAYQTFHRDWSSQVAEEAQRLLEIKPDLVLSNIAYLPLAAARHAGIPAVAYCCLNWADIFNYYLGQEPGATTIHDQILAAYASARAFLRPEPAMPMPDLETRAIGPVARIGRNQRDALIEQLTLSATTRLVLASLGGIKTELNYDTWPQIDDVCYLIPEHGPRGRSDFRSFRECNIGFIDVIASADVFLCKPGYGSFAEAACNGISVLYSEREWCEAPYLIQWLQSQVPAQAILPSQLQRGDFKKELLQLLGTSRVQPCSATGVTQCAEYLRNLCNI
ncbi:MAG: hypothetical protein HY272_12895 [Gammaproteobacteria bacterium]|nr:hypothetical protein [Gammaproteobacteria bacterium]